nr:helix-turn-helix domain-containing protein [Brevundimonas alba]
MTARTAEVRPPVIARAGDPEAQVEVVVHWLEAQRRAANWALDPVVRAEVEGAEQEEQAATRSPAEHRALQRRFRDRVGIPPRILRSILRFRRVFDHAGEPESEGWLQAGLDAGYFDQPQLARDFRRFLGCTATEWAREQVGLARLIASQSYKPGPLSPH